MHLETDLIAFPAAGDWAGARPPYLWRRCKPGMDARIQALRGWISARLALSARVSVFISEWVSFDSREVPHTTLIAISDGDRFLSASIGKPIARIELEDLLEHVIAHWQPLHGPNAGPLGRPALSAEVARGRKAPPTKNERSADPHGRAGALPRGIHREP